MARGKTEQSNRFSVFFLKRHGYLDRANSYASGRISWSYGVSENKSSIGFSLIREDYGTPSERTYIRLHYTHTDHWNGKTSDMNHDIQLEATPCRYGGKRYWFICPLTKNGRYCGKRVGVIYSIGKWFGCRHCGELAYSAQFEGGRFRTGSVCEPDVERAYAEIKRAYYNGKLTRRYRRYLRLKKRLNNFWMRASMRLGVKF